MKIILPIFFVLFTLKPLFSQEIKNISNYELTNTTMPKYELSTSLLIPAKIFELYGERYFSKETSHGIGVHLNIDGEFFLAKYFFRKYFGEANNQAGGFFLGLNAGVITRLTYNEAICLGINLGWKFLTDENWTGEISFSIDRSFIGADYGYPQFGLLLGRRF